MLLFSGYGSLFKMSISFKIHIIESLWSFSTDLCHTSKKAKPSNYHHATIPQLALMT